MTNGKERAIDLLAEAKTATGFKRHSLSNITLQFQLCFHDYSYDGYLLPSKLVSYGQEFASCPENLTMKMVVEGNLPVVRSVFFQWAKNGPVQYRPRQHVRLNQRFGKVNGATTYCMNYTCEVLENGEWFPIAYFVMNMINTGNMKRKPLPEWMRLDLPVDKRGVFNQGLLYEMKNRVDNNLFPKEKNAHPETVSSLVMPRPTDCDLNQHINFASYIRYYEDERYLFGFGSSKCLGFYVEFVRETLYKDIQQVFHISRDPSEIMGNMLHTKLYFVKDKQTVQTRCLWVEKRNTFSSNSNL